MKNYLIENGKMLLMWVNDVMDNKDIHNLPISKRCADVLADAAWVNSFENISESDAIMLFKEFIEPVTFGDIDIRKIDPFYVEVYNECGRLWLSLPDKFKIIVCNS